MPIRRSDPIILRMERKRVQVRPRPEQVLSSAALAHRDLWTAARRSDFEHYVHQTTELRTFVGFDMKTIVACVSLLLCVLLTCRTALCAQKPPFYDDIIRQCNVKDQESLDRCLYHLLDSMRPYLRDGIPEWNIPAMEPLSIRGISLNQGGGNTRIRATFKGLNVSGLSDYTITYVKSYPAQMKFAIGLQFPKLHTKGEYNIFGNLLLIPIKGQGPFWADFKNVTADSYNWLDVAHPAGSPGPGRMYLSRTQTDFDIGKVQLRLEKLFNSDEFLGETVNTFLNENAHDIIREVKPQFAQEIDRVVQRVFAEAIASLPVEFWKKLDGGKDSTDKEKSATNGEDSTNKKKSASGGEDSTDKKKSASGGEDSTDKKKSASGGEDSTDKKKSAADVKASTEKVPVVEKLPSDRENRTPIL